MSPTIAYLSQGKAYIKPPDKPAQLIESPFVQGILDRVERDRQRNDWKKDGMGWNFAGAQAGMMGIQLPQGEVRRIHFSGLTKASNSRHILYALDTDYVGGLFEYDPSDGTERRLVHRQGFHARGVSRNLETGWLVSSVQKPDGTAHLAIMAPDGKGLKEITEGDCVDEAATWVPGNGQKLVFQSAGIGRNQQGFRTGLGSYAIHELDIDKGQMTIVVEDDDHDLLTPRMTPDGSLYYVRRPYQSHPPVSPWKVGLDVLLFPYRVVLSIVHFLNFFSLMFSRKPLITSGGPPKEGPDTRYLMLWGKVIDAETMLRKSQKKGAAASLVPATWELVRRSSDGKEDVLAKSVISFDLAADGSIVYTNGSGVFELKEGQSRELFAEKMIEHVSVVG